MRCQNSNDSFRRGTWRGTRRKSEFAQTKPEGGFCFVPALGFIATWWAYKRQILSLADVRVWLAIFEVVARRCIVQGNRSFSCVEHELAAIVGGDAEHVAASLRRLERLGYLRRSRTTFQATCDIDRLTREERDELSQLLDQVKNHRRRVPVPRRILRLLTRTARPVFWATTVGHLLRCMYYRNRQCAPDGRCKASWIANVFEVDVRNVKAARRELIEHGLLFMDPTDQCSMNRWGPRVRFNLTWKCDTPVDAAPPRSSGSTPQLPPPRKNRELASRLVDQEPARAAALGYPTSRSWHLEASELKSLPALQRLFERCVTLRLCIPGEAARLAFFATAARALRVATSNAPGLFATLVRSKRWGFATLADEDLARRWLRQLSTADVCSSAPPSTRSRTSHTQERAPRTPEAAAIVLRRLLPNLLPHSVNAGPPRPIGVGDDVTCESSRFG